MDDVYISTLYTAFIGSFNETLNDDTVEINTEQNPPLSIGILGKFKPGGFPFGLVGNMYFSFINANQKISIPLEMEGHGYVQYFTRYLLNPFIGFELEKFSSFNTDELAALTADLSAKNNFLFMASIGIEEIFRIYKFPIRFKFTYSKTLHSLSDHATVFEGNKYTTHIAMDYTPKLFFHLFYKLHKLKGISDLTIHRLGLGFGYKFY